MSLHLFNLANAQRADRFLTTDFIPPVGPITVEMRMAERPKRLRWIPDGGRLKWSWSDGVLTATIPALKIHGVLVVE